MKTTLLAVTCLALALILAYQSFLAWDARLVRQFQSSYTGFLRDVLVTGCVDKAAFVQTAKERGWQVDDPAKRVYVDSGTEAATNAIRVFVQPPLNLSKEPGVVFRFDADGCLLSRR